MSKNVILNGTTYSGISEVTVPISGGTARFKDVDEITTPSGSLSITANGTYDVTDKASAVVNVSGGSATLQSKSVSVTANGSQTVSPDSGYDGLSSVALTVNVPTSATTQSKTVTPDAAGQTVSPDSGYDGLSSVVINGDADLVAGNIKKDVEIFGVTGTYEGSATVTPHWEYLGYNATDGIQVKQVGTTMAAAPSNSTYICWSVELDDACTEISGSALSNLYSTLNNITSNNNFANVLSVTYDFKGAHLADKTYTFPNVTSDGGFVQCKLKELHLPKKTTIGNCNFYGCPNMEKLTIGSEGYGVTSCASSQIFDSGYIAWLSNSEVTIYTTGANVDDFLTKIRACNSVSTFIFKASENTTYNGTAYSAGYTMLTDAPSA